MYTSSFKLTQLKKNIKAQHDTGIAVATRLKLGQVNLSLADRKVNKFKKETGKFLASS